MIFKAILSSKASPGYGQVTIPFPILDSEYPILNRLTAQSVNVDELDYLATRLSSFSDREDDQFVSMASKLCLSDIKDLINLTFCCQQATVITSFSDLERVGKSHSLTINGGAMPAEEYDQVDGRMVALDLLQNKAGTITPYGVVYDNGMKLEQFYNGRSFPELYLGPQQLIIEISSGPHGKTSGFLYLPCPHKPASAARAASAPPGPGRSRKWGRRCVKNHQSQ